MILSLKNAVLNQPAKVVIIYKKKKRIFIKNLKTAKIFI
jgi:hypothetical protein